MNHNDQHYNLVVGLGEIGKPLLEVLKKSYHSIGRDLEPVDFSGQIDVLHICYPYEIDDFVYTTVNYINTYSPMLTIIHSTVVPGTTAAIYDRLGNNIAYSPVRGKHSRMVQELYHYTKYVAGATQEASNMALRHLDGAGLKVRQFPSCESLELSKLVETTYFGLLIAWAQEIERYCKHIGADYDDVMGITEEIGYLPPVIFSPGYIGGHCVIPNTYILDKIRPSEFIDIIRSSNELKKLEWLGEGRALEERITPKYIIQDDAGNSESKTKT